MDSPRVLGRTRPRTWLRLSIALNALAFLALLHTARLPPGFGPTWVPQLGGSGGHDHDGGPVAFALDPFAGPKQRHAGAGGGHAVFATPLHRPAGAGRREAADEVDDDDDVEDDEVVDGSAVGEVPRGQQDTCTLCGAAPELCNELGADFLVRSVGHEGSNARLRRFLAKLRRGEAVTIATVGGSVSTGHGLMVHDARTAPSNMHRRIFDRLSARFPSPWARAHASERAGAAAEDGTHAFGALVGGADGAARSEGKHAFVNGAIPASGANYFSMCFAEHIPHDADLVLVELAINDQFALSSFESYERLTRALLDLPNQPAVLDMHVFALMFDTVALGGDLHHSLAQYYDLPVVSLRNPLLPRILKNHSMVYDWFNNAGSEIDLRHLGTYGHRVVGDLVSAYIDKQLCEMDAIEAAVGTTDVDVLYPIEPVPRILLTMKYDEDTVVPVMRPNCFTTAGEKSPLVPAEQTGWREWSWKDKKYWIAETPGSRISFKFSTVLGTVKLFYLRSREFGLGSVSCWVDDDAAAAVRIDGYWTYPFNTGQEADVRKDLKPGEHTLHCELKDHTLDPAGGKEFRIIGVFSY
ncbi:hypothetical protein Q5752_006000 [Cryptotrichosporon argae]